MFKILLLKIDSIDQKQRLTNKNTNKNIKTKKTKIDQQMMTCDTTMTKNTC